MRKHRRKGQSRHSQGFAVSDASGDGSLSSDRLGSFFGQALRLSGDQRDARFKSAADDLRKAMERDAEHLAELVLKQPPLDLLAYLWSLLHISTMDSHDPQSGGPHDEEATAPVIAALEYAHAVWSCFNRRTEEEKPLDQVEADEIVDLVARIRDTAMMHSLATSRSTKGPFGKATGSIEFAARSSWILIRGNRYQVLEQEFFDFVLAPHDDALRDAYGVGASDIAVGIQAIATSMREGFSRAADVIHERMEATRLFGENNGISMQQAIATLAESNSKTTEAIGEALLDLFRAGVCNVSRQTLLPHDLLQDLAYERGQNREFFAVGDFCGTPLRTLPARIKPLIALDDGYYATDGSFVRDSAYRSLARGVSNRLPTYREEWNRRQKSLTETAFQTIFRKQLRDFTALTEVFYREPSTQQWIETDTIIAADDVLIVVEAKAGVGAMRSPATHFDDHVRSVNKLVVDAYNQTRRFLDYLTSAPDVPLYHLRDGLFEEVHRLSLDRLRMVLPVGLTVESFTPFSAMCKELPSVTPILGRYPFVAMSVDDLFVLNRFLTTTGELLHYLGLRQRVAGIKGAELFDEIDHLGAYVAKNRFDLDLKSRLENFDVVTWDGFSTEVDNYFRQDRWLTEPPPRQRYPSLLQAILDHLDHSRTPGWRAADATIRDLSDTAREALDNTLRDLAATLLMQGSRWFATSGHDVATLFFWLYRDGDDFVVTEVKRRAELSAMASRQRWVHVICVGIDELNSVSKAQTIQVEPPDPKREDYRELVKEADAMRRRTVSVAGAERRTVIEPPGRNSPCWCGSGAKFKKCHGR
jgi:hypothetical protein